MSTAVLGDGPAGAAAAVAAARRGERSWLIGRGQAHPHGTLEVLSGRATSGLVTLGWFDAVVARGRPCVAIISRWAGDAYVERSALLEPGGFGWIVDRAWLDPLLQRLAERDGVKRMVDRERPPPGTRQVVAAGKHAPQHGHRRVLGPDQLALTVTLPAGSVSELASQLLLEAAPDGWWSALDDGSALAVTFTSEVTKLSGGPHWLQRSWARALTAGPGWLPPAAFVATPRARPVRTRLHLSSPGSPIRVGDAALSVDPLSGHGLALAIEGALRCARPGYSDWLIQQADDHERAGWAAHEAVPYDTAFWRTLSQRVVPDQLQRPIPAESD